MQNFWICDLCFFHFSTAAEMVWVFSILIESQEGEYIQDQWVERLFSLLSTGCHRVDDLLQMPNLSQTSGQQLSQHVKFTLDK